MLSTSKLTAGLSLIAALAVVAVIVGVISLDGDDVSAPAPESELEAAAGEQELDPEAIVLFDETCGACHTLSVAGTSGDVGPNLDEDVYDTERVLTAIEEGPGQMAAGLLSGEDAQKVAELIGNDEPLR